VPIRFGSGTDIGSVRLGDGTEIAEVRKGDGTVLFNGRLPDSAVAHYDATQESSTGDITTLTDREGGTDLSGSCSVIASGIDSKQTYRFDGVGDRMASTSLGVTSEPFAVVFVAQLRETSDEKPFHDNENDAGEFYFRQEVSNNRYSLYRNSAGVVNGGSPDTSAHVFVTEGFNGDDGRIRVDGTEFTSSLTSPSENDLSGFVLADSGSNSGSNLEVDIGEVIILENHSDSELTDAEQQLADTWGITLS